MPDIHPLAFNIGIEQIIRGGTAGTERLPEHIDSLFPSEAHLSRRLESVFEAPSVEERLLSFLKPEVRNKHILTPQGYASMIESVHQTLQEAIEESDEGESDDSLKKAAALLKGEKELLELLSTYRGMLMKA